MRYHLGQQASGFNSQLFTSFYSGFTHARGDFAIFLAVVGDAFQ
jgi:hypothetical protein